LEVGLPICKVIFENPLLIPAKRIIINIMDNYVYRTLTAEIERKLSNIPVVAILGPRQCGKSTLAKVLLSSLEGYIYLDLERPSDMNKLRDAEAYFKMNKGKLICLDEIQRAPELFTIIRSAVDENNKNGQFIILGSASPDLLKQSSETLAGRISYLELTPFLIREVVQGNSIPELRKLWLRGGFPRSYLASGEQESYEWRLDFIRTFLERDIPTLGFTVPAGNIERFWRMCAHVHGQVLNRSKLGESLGVSHHTIQSYLDILKETFIVRVLAPFESNLKKRLVKSPKIYIRDSGLLHALLQIADQDDLLGHPGYGSSWEGFALENILASAGYWRHFFYRTSSGSEIDLVLEKGKCRIAVEFKVSTSPSVSRGFWQGFDDLEAAEGWIIAPVDEPYPLKSNVTVAPPETLTERLLR
jgi:predicted AAA+ superfamily ATPase